MAPIANFYEYYCIGVEHDQIELADTAAPVLCKQAQTMLFKILPGLCLGSVSALFRAGALAQLMLSGSG